jgi:hypothetical protein
MTTKELIRTLGLRHLSSSEVRQIEEAMNSDDAEMMLTAVDAIVGKARKPNPARATQKDRRRP